MVWHSRDGRWSSVVKRRDSETVRLCLALRVVLVDFDANADVKTTVIALPVQIARSLVFGTSAFFACMQGIVATAAICRRLRLAVGAP
jgi:hypothetical protein